MRENHRASKQFLARGVLKSFTRMASDNFDAGNTLK
jgi:hypothetical protein